MSWVKKHWRTLLFPFLALVGVFIWIARKGEKPLSTFISGTTDEAAASALKEKDKAIEEYQKHLDHIEAKAKAAINKASADQLKDMSVVLEKSPKDLAKWIDEVT